MAFGFMLGAVFFGNYKKVRTRFRSEQKGFLKTENIGPGISCGGCTGDCKH